MSDLDDIRGFVEVLETGGFGRAARRLNVSKSIISRRIARLEADLGTRLLTRTTRGISPTEAGIAFLARSQRILADLEAAREEVAQHGGAIMGLLRVSLPLSFGVRHVAPVLAALSAAHPKLEIDAAYSDRFVDLVAERFDVAVRIGTLRDSALVARRIADASAALVASPDYLARRGAPRHPADLAQHDALIYTGTAEREQWRFRAGKRWISVRPTGRLRADSGDALLQAASAGLGLAMLPTFLAADAIEAGKVVPVLTDYDMQEVGIFVVRPSGQYVPGKVRVLIDALVARFSGTPDWDRCQMAARERAGARK